MDGQEAQQQKVVVTQAEARPVALRQGVSSSLSPDRSAGAWAPCVRTKVDLRALRAGHGLLQRIVEAGGRAPGGTARPSVGPPPAPDPSSPPL